MPSQIYHAKTLWYFVILTLAAWRRDSYGSSLPSDDDCVFQDLCHSVASVTCAIERGAWFISNNTLAMKNVGCLLGADRCRAVRHVPTETEVSPSPTPPAAKNKQYQALATTAESIVPKTWWRDGFADPQLLLTAKDHELPRKQFDASTLQNKKLKNLLQCITRQQFIRKSFAFDLEPEIDAIAATKKCTAMKEPVVISFFEQWNTGDNNVNFGGELRKEPSSGRLIWAPIEQGDGKLLVSALQVSSLQCPVSVVTILSSTFTTLHTKSSLIVFIVNYLTRCSIFSMPIMAVFGRVVFGSRGLLNAEERLLVR